MLSKLLTIVSIIGLVSCSAGLPPNTPPEVVKLTLQDKVVAGLGIFQDTAIGANAQKLLSDNDTRVIVETVKSSVIVVRAASSGWQAAVVTALTEAKSHLSVIAQEKYGNYINLVIAVILGIPSGS